MLNIPELDQGEPYSYKRHDVVIGLKAFEAKSVYPRVPGMCISIFVIKGYGCGWHTCEAEEGTSRRHTYSMIARPAYE
jgi:hypothetical protein